MFKYIIINTKTGKAVQTWSYADKKHIIYCTDPYWAMKFDKESDCIRTITKLLKDFPNQSLSSMKIKIKTIIEFG